MSAGIQIAGWTLLHVVWQGTAIALVTAGALRLLGQRSANTRYVVACLGLAVMLAAPVVTAAVLARPTATVSPVMEVSEPGSGAASAVAGPVAVNGSNIAGLAIRTVRNRVDAWLPFVVIAWLAGVTGLLGRMAGGLWRVRRLHLAAIAAPASSWQAVCTRLASRLGLGATPHVAELRSVETPTVIGWVRPVILLPIAALANLTPSQVEAILAHELVHIRRHDFAVNVAQTVAETLLFYHPGVWWLSGRIRVEREHCCDDAAVELSGDAVEYARALTELEAWRSSGTTLALGVTTGSLGSRVRRILRLPYVREPRSLSGAVSLMLALVLVVGVGALRLPGVDVSGATPAATERATAQREPLASPDSFDWQLYATSHFDMYYYPALADDLERIEEAAELAYERVTTALAYNLAFRVPLILFKTREEFEQQDIAPGGSMEWVTAFAEPKRNRIVVLVDEGGELSPRITHELTHVVAFDIIPREPEPGRGTTVPVWVDEGLADYVAGAWTPEDLTGLRDLVLADSVPQMTTFVSESGSSETRLAYVLGHAVFDFIEATHGKAAVTQFLFELRRNVIDGTGDLYQAAFYQTPEEFDAAFTGYLKTRFAGAL